MRGTAGFHTPLDEVWATLRDFEYSADFPYVDDIHIEDGEPPDKVGCVQNASLTEEAPTSQLMTGSAKRC